MNDNQKRYTVERIEKYNEDLKNIKKDENKTIMALTCCALTILIDYSTKLHVTDPIALFFFFTSIGCTPLLLSYLIKFNRQKIDIELKIDDLQSSLEINEQQRRYAVERIEKYNNKLKEIKSNENEAILALALYVSTIIIEIVDYLTKGNTTRPLISYFLFASIALTPYTLNCLINSIFNKVGIELKIENLQNSLEMKEIEDIQTRTMRK